MSRVTCGIAVEGTTIAIGIGVAYRIAGLTRNAIDGPSQARAGPAYSTIEIATVTVLILITNIVSALGRTRAAVCYTCSAAFLRVAGVVTACGRTGSTIARARLAVFPWIANIITADGCAWAAVRCTRIAVFTETACFIPTYRFTFAAVANARVTSLADLTEVIPAHRLIGPAVFGALRFVFAWVAYAIAAPRPRRAFAKRVVRVGVKTSVATRKRGRRAGSEGQGADKIETGLRHCVFFQVRELSRPS